MRKFLLSCALLVAGISATIAQTPVIGITFDENGPVLSGSDAANHTAAAFSTAINDTWIYQDPITGKYIGTTNNSAGGFYYVTYNATDALGQTFAKGGTWEILYRMDKKQCVTTNTSGKASNNGTAKFFSSQQSGGWSMYYYPGGDNGGLKFDYVTNDGEANKTATIKPGMEKANIQTGEFNHIIVTVDKTNSTMVMYLNGEKVGETSNYDLLNDFQFPNIGNPRMTENMWFSLGADPAGIDAPSNKGSENSSRSSFVFANIYDKVLTSDEVAARYADETVQYYTNTKPTTASDLIWDVVAGPAGSVRDASPYGIVNVVGTMTTQYNPTFHRYEVVNEAPNSENFAYRYYGYDQTITSRLNNSMAVEVLCKANESLPAAITSPLSFQQDGGIGFEFQTTGTVRFNYNDYGYNATSAGASNLSTWTDAEFLNTEYNHYVVVSDRPNNKSYIYVNGELVKEYSVTTEGVDMANQSVTFPSAPYQWFCFNGDTKGGLATACDYPFNGNIVIGRVWGKALTAGEVTVLYTMAANPTIILSVYTNNLATAIFPFDAVVPAGAKAYIVDAVNGTVAHTELLASEGEVIPYGTPVIIKGATGNYTFKAADLTTATVKAIPAVNLLEGSYVTTEVKAGQVYTLSLLEEQFDISTNRSIAADKAWLPASAISLAEVSNITLDGDINEFVVAINGVKSEIENSPVKCFENGRIVIKKAGKTYSVDGKLIN